MDVIGERKFIVNNLYAFHFVLSEGANNDCSPANCYDSQVIWQKLNLARKIPLKFTGTLPTVHTALLNLALHPHVAAILAHGTIFNPSFFFLFCY